MANHSQVLAIFNNLAQKLFTVIFYYDESSSEDEETGGLLNRVNIPKKRHKVHKVARINNYLEVVIPTYTDNFRVISELRDVPTKIV